MVVIYHECVVLLLDSISVCYWCLLPRQFFTSGPDGASWDNQSLMKDSNHWHWQASWDIDVNFTGLSVKEYRYTRWGDATDSVTEWLLGEQYIYVSTSCVTCVRLAEWSSIGSANRDSIAQAQRVGSIATGILLYLLSFFSVFILSSFGLS
jgi:hypothetical protein